MNTEEHSKIEPVYLRSLELDDLEETHKWHNDPALYESLTGPFRYVSRGAEKEWLQEKQAYSNRQISLAICLSSNSEHIGNIYLCEIDWIARHAKLAIFIGESKCQSKGYGQAAICLLQKHAFEDLGLSRLYLHVLEDNKRAIRVYEKCGFVVEGRLPRHALKKGKLKDVLVMGMCIREFCRNSSLRH
ncbi:MAG: GNAT family N-acetyltransferase [Sedimentisphaerales bacterium]|nr:GNAT family N-acetyltransferase [Sedimentisphaerales bacterium]